jgi:hypothetical protein
MVFCLFYKKKSATPPLRLASATQARLLGWRAKYKAINATGQCLGLFGQSFWRLPEINRATAFT